MMKITLSRAKDAVVRVTHKTDRQTDKLLYFEHSSRGPSRPEAGEALPRYSPEFYFSYLTPLHRLKRGLDKTVNGKGDRETTQGQTDYRQQPRGWV
jgi:hypothetical protein